MVALLRGRTLLGAPPSPHTHTPPFLSWGCSCAGAQGRFASTQRQEVSQPALKAKEMNTLPSDGTYARKYTLLPEHAKVERKKKKGNTDRLWKAMGLPAPKGRA